MIEFKECSTKSLLELKKKIEEEIEERENLKVKSLTDDFLQMWEEMSELGIRLKMVETWDTPSGSSVRDLQIEINDRIIEIY